MKQQNDIFRRENYAVKEQLLNRIFNQCFNSKESQKSLTDFIKSEKRADNFEVIQNENGYFAIYFDYDCSFNDNSNPKEAFGRVQFIFHNDVLVNFEFNLDYLDGKNITDLIGDIEI